MMMVSPRDAGFGSMELITMSHGGLTVTLINFEAVHPVGPVPITVYVVVSVGLAVTAAPVVADRPVAGDHV